MDEPISNGVPRPPRALTPINRGMKAVQRTTLPAWRAVARPPAAAGPAKPEPPAAAEAVAAPARPAASPAGGHAPGHLKIPRLVQRQSALAAPAPAAQRRGPMAFFSHRYKPEAIIGQGGRGAVYKAWDNVLGVHVALKFLPEGLALKPAAVEEIRHEAVVTMRLAHENIVRLHNVEMTGQRLFLVMEYVDGENLRQILNRLGPLAPESVLDIVRSCASALAYAHKIGIIHRDLKPENLMVTRDSVLKIVDFGTAMMVHAPGTNEYMEGSPGYMSPEQVRGDVAVDARTDVFSLGAVAGELLTGKPLFPFDGNTDHLVSAVEAGPQGLDALAPAVVAVLARAVAVDREQRWPTAVAFHQALGKAIGDPSAGA